MKKESRMGKIVLDFSVSFCDRPYYELQDDLTKLIGSKDFQMEYVASLGIKRLLKIIFLLFVRKVKP